MAPHARRQREAPPLRGEDARAVDERHEQREDKVKLLLHAEAPRVRQRVVVEAIEALVGVAGAARCEVVIGPAHDSELAASAARDSNTDP